MSLKILVFLGFCVDASFWQALQRFAFSLKQNLSPNALKSLISGSVR